MSRTIFRCRFGSHLYGTSTPASDLDFKSVVVPGARDILLQRVKQADNTARPKGEGEKNYAGEVEEERFSLQKFLKLLSEGQTVAIDCLFAPEWAMTMPPEPEWMEVVANKDRLLTRKSAAFIGYARKQASKYGIRGSRVAASRKALGLLHAALSTEKLASLEADIRAMVSETEHMDVNIQTMPNGTEITHWEVCGRKMPFTASIKNAHDITQRLVDEYGHRALQAESNQGVDWKALSHAVRVGHQAIELLETGHVTFPLPNAAHVLDIKLGNLDYKDVAAEIEDLMVKVEAAAETSILPAEPDYEWIDDFVTRVYQRQVIG